MTALLLALKYWREIALAALITALIACALLIDHWHTKANEVGTMQKQVTLLQQQVVSLRTQLDAEITKNIKDTYETAISVPVPHPVYRLCPTTGVSSPPSTPATGDHGPAPLPAAGDAGAPVNWDAGPVIEVGRDADAQVNALRAYIEKECH